MNRVAIEKFSKTGIRIIEHFLHAKEISFRVKPIATVNVARQDSGINEEQHRKRKCEAPHMVLEFVAGEDERRVSECQPLCIGVETSRAEDQPCNKDCEAKQNGNDEIALFSLSGSEKR